MYVNGPLVVALTNHLLRLVREAREAGEPPLTSYHIPAKEFLNLEREIRRNPHWNGYAGNLVTPHLEVNGIKVRPFLVLEPSHLLAGSVETVEEYEARINHPRYEEFLNAAYVTDLKRAREQAFEQAFDDWRRTGRYRGR